MAPIKTNTKDKSKGEEEIGLTKRPFFTHINLR